MKSEKAVRDNKRHRFWDYETKTSSTKSPPQKALEKRTHEGREGRERHGSLNAMDN